VKAELPLKVNETFEKFVKKNSPKKTRDKKKSLKKEEMVEVNSSEEEEDYELLEVCDESGEIKFEPPAKKETNSIMHYVDNEGIEMYHGHKVKKLVQIFFGFTSVCFFSLQRSLYFFCSVFFLVLFLCAFFLVTFLFDYLQQYSDLHLLKNSYLISLKIST
jgi:hypothetical protein